MPTFLLKKYSQTPAELVNQENTQTVASSNSEEKKESDEPEEMKITVTGTISQIVAIALQKVLVNTNVNMEEVENEDKESQVKAISSENINKEPIDTLRSIKDNDFVFIQTSGFTTAQEDWFLTNVNNKTKNVVYTIESFINHIKKHFKIA